ncbi:DUF4855 domain-containing protein [Streptomyces sp. NBC_00237]|uniref:DUF4855 domain-containing protein n=1 Tax=Streptomyces sp. NBC_00237 TaxID=2975687 RepID=UPI0022505D94|nr:DUF4855 domain-containing protein [Streptomyces sp. NBC_00237]MCX5200603.1 DUF4855 domain-containing protein [Streptomyces sp. NBC_00237]
MITKATFLVATTLLAAALGPSALEVQPPPDPGRPTGYLSPARAGFQHAALVYHESRRRPAHLDALASLGFDAYVALRFVAPATGECTDYGATTLADWRGLLDAWFGGAGGAGGDEGDLARLDAAVGRAGKGPSQVVVAVPWPSPEQHAFGAVEAGGRSLDFRRAEDRTAAVDWYAREVRARFASAGLRHLRLWGLYFMREDATGGDPAWLPQATAAVHARRMRALWIPYADAPGVEESARLGFDAVVLQPSYAFTSPLDGGTTSASRLRSTARRAQRLGLGVEIEARRGGVDADGGRLLRQYLAEGAAQGYQGAVSAWFMGWGDTVPWRPGSPVRGPVGDYLAGRTVRDDDLHPEWEWDGGRSVARSSFPARDGLRALRVDLEDGAARTVSLVRVRTHAAGGGWQDAGWAAVRPPEHIDREGPSVAVPLALRGGVDGLEVRFDRGVGSAASGGSRGSGGSGGSGGSVRMTGDVQWQWPPVPARVTSPALYPDRGQRQLTDGVWAAGGWEAARSVGWSGWLGETRVAVDLGRVRSLSRVVVRTHGGGGGGGPVAGPASGAGVGVPGLRSCGDRRAAVSGDCGTGHRGRAE